LSVWSNQKIRHANPGGLCGEPMERPEAIALIRAMLDRDLPHQQFVSLAAAQRMAEAFTVVFETKYVGVKSGYTFRVEPASGAVKLVVRK
jgi:hypothetical protein